MPLQIKILIVLVVLFIFYKALYVIIYRPCVDLYNVTLEYQKEYQQISDSISNNKDTIYSNVDLLEKKRNVMLKHNVILDIFPNNLINTFMGIKKLE